MKLIPLHYDPANEWITLQIDRQAQTAFVISMKRVKAFRLDRAVRRMAANREQEFDRNLGVAFQTLKQLAQINVDQIEVRVTALQLTLQALLLATNYHVGIKRRLADKSDALVLLALVTPFPIAKFSLPPAIEVFDREKIAPSAWNGFETIRLWNEPGPPHLFLLQMYQLRMALEADPPTNQLLKDLLHHLAGATGLFHDTVRDLAIAHVLPMKAKPSRKRKKR